VLTDLNVVSLIHSDPFHQGLPFALSPAAETSTVYLSAVLSIGAVVLSDVRYDVVSVSEPVRLAAEARGPLRGLLNFEYIFGHKVTFGLLGRLSGVREVFALFLEFDLHCLGLVSYLKLGNVGELLLELFEVDAILADSVVEDGSVLGCPL